MPELWRMAWSTPATSAACDNSPAALGGEAAAWGTRPVRDRLAVIAGQGQEHGIFGLVIVK